MFTVDLLTEKQLNSTININNGLFFVFVIVVHSVCSFEL